MMAWRRPGDKPLSEPMVVRLPMHICVTRPQWVNHALFLALSVHCTECTICFTHAGSVPPVLCMLCKVRVEWKNCECTICSLSWLAQILSASWIKKSSQYLTRLIMFIWTQWLNISYHIKYGNCSTMLCLSNKIRAHFLSLARSKLRLCSANHRSGYWSNLPCDWPSRAWVYSEQETENGPRCCNNTVQYNIQWI